MTTKERIVAYSFLGFLLAGIGFFIIQAIDVIANLVLIFSELYRG